MTGQADARDGHIPARLPRGPHRLPRDTVQASQRQRILSAVLDAVGEHGYAGATMRHITAAAGVSRSAFYELFADKQAAYLVAYDEYTAEFFGGLVSASGHIGSVAEVVDICVDLLVRRAREEPLRARAVNLEVYAAGPDGLTHRDQGLAVAEAVFDNLAAWLRRRDPTLPPLDAGIAKAVIAASFELCAQALRCPEADRPAFAQSIRSIWLLGLTGTARVEV